MTSIALAGVGCWLVALFFFFFSSRRRHTRFDCDWSSDVCSSDLFWARSGLLFMTRDAGTPPTWPVAGSGDNATAVCVYAAIATALYRRERTEIGRASCRERV